MKLINIRFLLLIMLVSLPLGIVSAPGCQDNSLHLERGTIDYKQWHYVACTCPCDKYQLRPDNRCSECEHLHTAIRLVHPEAVASIKILNVPELKAFARAKKRTG